VGTFNKHNLTLKLKQNLLKAQVNKNISTISTNKILNLQAILWN